MDEQTNWMHLLAFKIPFPKRIHGDIKINKCVDLMLVLLLLDLVDKISENGWNIYESYEINQTIQEIDFDSTFPNDLGRLTVWRFGISKYYH